jgi:acyl-CoA dehydrogenase
MARVAVSEALMRIVDRFVQAMGGMGGADETIVAQELQGIRAFRIDDGATAVHEWSLAKTIGRDGKAALP